MKNALLIAGGGTLGSYTSEELVRLGYDVDVICLEDNESTENLHFFKERATVEYLEKFLAGKHYTGIVNFLHFPRAEQFAPYFELLTKYTDQLVVLSSYRVYADSTPITESSPLLGDVSTDEDFLANETYAMGKYRCEKYLRASEHKNWTVIRPVISFSKLRLDVIMRSGHEVIDAAKSGTPLTMPLGSKDIYAGLDWAGNSGKLIAHLIGKEAAIGETFTISSAPNLKWSEVADIYTELLGTKFDWIPDDEYVTDNKWGYIYDRKFSRFIDASHVLEVTGLTKSDFKSIREGIVIELDKLGIEVQ